MALAIWRSIACVVGRKYLFLLGFRLVATRPVLFICLGICHCFHIFPANTRGRRVRADLSQSAPAPMAFSGQAAGPLVLRAAHFAFFFLLKSLNKILFFIFSNGILCSIRIFLFVR